MAISQGTSEINYEQYDMLDLGCKTEEFYLLLMFNDEIETIEVAPVWLQVVDGICEI